MSNLFGSTPKSKQPTAALGIDIQTAEYGKVLPVAFGRNKWAGTVIWYGQFKAIKHTQKPSGSKGGGSQKQVSYTYTCSYMVAMCEGIATPIKAYDGAAEKSPSAVGGIAFTGALGQSVWSNLSGLEAIGYSGTSLIAFKDKNLGDQPSLPQLSFEMAGRNQLNEAGGVYDADPADIATAICTDTGIGVGFTGLGDLSQWSNYCRAADLLFSPIYDTQQPALQVLSELLKYSNSEGWFSEGKLKVKPRGDRALTGNGVTYTPDLTPVANLGPNDLITNGANPAVIVRRKSPADAMNVVRIEHRERAQKYRTIPATGTIDEDMVNTGVRAETSETVDMITRSRVGQLVADNMVQRDFYVRNGYEFKLSWRFCYLEPMDIVTLTDAPTGLNLTPVRLLRITEDADGLLKLEAEEMPDGVGHAAFLDPQSADGTGVDPDADPGPVTAPYIFRAPNALVPAGQPEVWVAVAGNDPLWAGCEVFLSRDGSSYTYHSTFARESTYGVTTNALAVTADPYTAGAVNVQLYGAQSLLGCTATECDEFVTLSMLDDELIAYQTAALAAGPSYDLGTRIRRGGYGSAIAAHAVGAKFVRLNEDILRIPIDPSQVGNTIYIKFVSLNVFGRGGRTLAGETAYAYTIGTRSDFPDVPATPNSLIAKSVVDGVNLAWVNPSPMAVGATSIEFATASGGPWTVLGQTGPTGTSFHHAFADGAVYFYRVRARGFNIAGGWSAYTATVSAQGYNTAGSVDSLMLNPNFDQGFTNWSQVDAGFYLDSGVNALSGQSVFRGPGNTAAFSRLLNARRVRVKPGQVVMVGAAIGAFGSPNGGAYVSAVFWGPTGSYVTDRLISFSTGQVIGGSAWRSVVKRIIIPAGVYEIQLGAVVNGHTAGYWGFDSFRGTFVDDFYAGAASGDSIIPNYNFSANEGAWPTSTSYSPWLVGDPITDGWVIDTLNDSAVFPGGMSLGVENSLLITGQRQLFIGNQAATLAGATGCNAFVATYQKIPVNPGEKFVIDHIGRVDQGNSRPSGVTYTVYMGLWAYDKDDTKFAFLGAALLNQLGTFSASTTVTVPADTAYVRGIVGGTIANANGSATAIPWAIMHFRPQSLRVRRQSTLDDGVVTDGTVYGRVSNTDLINSGGVNRLGIRVPGSGQRVAPKNMATTVYANVGSMFDGLSVTSSYSTGDPSTVTISATAATLRASGEAPSYSSSSLTVSQSRGTAVRYYLYYTDPDLAGGSRSLSYTTTRAEISNASDRVYLDSILVTVPSGPGSGSGGTGGTGGAGGGAVP